MPGTGTVQNNGNSPGNVAAQIVVCLYNDNPQLTSGFFTPLPNVESIGIQRRKGADAGVGRFRYRMGENLNNAWPDRIEDIFGINVPPSPYIVNVDDELVVIQIDPTPSGTPGDCGWTVLFHGLAEVPQADATATTEAVTFQAVGIAARLWEVPIGGAVYRNGPDTTVDRDTQTDRPTRFNPEGKANAVITANWSTGVTETSTDEYPVFLDPTYMGGIENAEGGGMYLMAWTISMACRYLLWVYNAPPETNEDGEVFSSWTVQNPDFDMMTNILDYSDDPEFADDLVLDPIPVEDYDATGDPLPVAIEKLINPYKRAFYFKLDQDQYGRPQTSFSFYRTDDSDQQGPVDIYLAPAGSPYDPSTSNAASVSIHRLADQIVNNVIVDTELVRYEASFILSPAFTPSAADITTPNNFTIGNPNFTGSNVEKYRIFIFDESGEGHWAYDDTGNNGSWVTDIPSLDQVLGAPQPNPDGSGEPDVPQYANHRRPGLSPVFSRDSLGERIQAQLWVSTNYHTYIPGLWDGSGSWQQVSGGWELLKDRLGIQITIDAVNNWNIGRATGWTSPGQPPYPDGAVDLIKAFAATTPDPTTGKPMRLAFRLTCAIESDQDLGIESNWQIASTTSRQITRRIDGRDQFKKHVISIVSNLSTAGKTVSDRDDTANAQDYADAIVHAHACAPIQGTIVIPGLTDAYDISDPVRSIDGRDISLQVNQGVQQGENIEMPYITEISWDFDGQETTTIVIQSDHTEVPLRRRR